VAFWRRAFGGSAWSEALLAAAPITAHLVLVPSLPVFPGSQYLYAGPGQIGGASLFPVLPWLTLAALGGRALRESAAVDLASGLLLGAAAAAVVAIEEGPVLAQFSKFPMSLPYGLASGAVVGLAFALGRFQGFQGPALWALKWLGERWAVFFYVHFAVAEAIQRAGVTDPAQVWALLAVGGLTATALVSLPALLVAPGFRTIWPWLAVVGMIGAAAFAPGLNPPTVTALAGSAGLVFAAFHPELAALIADFRATAPPPSRPPTSSGPKESSSASTSREGAGTRPAEPTLTADSRRRMAVRAGVLAAALVSPEAVGWVGAKLSALSKSSTPAAPAAAPARPKTDPIQEEVERTQKAVDDLMRRPVPLQQP
ncbi:MAG: hypothetical protein U0835_27405, partial [Isosphaeraceae bacterium]